MAAVRMNGTRQTTPHAPLRQVASRASLYQIHPQPQSMRHEQRRARLRRRRRLQGLLRLVVVVALVLGVILIGVRVAGASSTAPRHYIVKSGDTLWSIAQRSYDGSHDPRQVVYTIEHANQLQGADLQPGTDLLLPIVN